MTIQVDLHVTPTVVLTAKPTAAFTVFDYWAKQDGVFMPFNDVTGDNISKMEVLFSPVSITELISNVNNLDKPVVHRWDGIPHDNDVRGLPFRDSGSVLVNAVNLFKGNWDRFQYNPGEIPRKWRSLDAHYIFGHLSNAGVGKSRLHTHLPYDLRTQVHNQFRFTTGNGRLLNLFTSGIASPAPQWNSDDYFFHYPNGRATITPILNTYHDVSVTKSGKVTTISYTLVQVRVVSASLTVTTTFRITYEFTYWIVPRPVTYSATYGFSTSFSVNTLVGANVRKLIVCTSQTYVGPGAASYKWVEGEPIILWDSGLKQATPYTMYQNMVSTASLDALRTALQVDASKSVSYLPNQLKYELGPYFQDTGYVSWKASVDAIESITSVIESDLFETLTEFVVISQYIDMIGVFRRMLKHMPNFANQRFMLMLAIINALGSAKLMLDFAVVPSITVANEVINASDGLSTRLLDVTRTKSYIGTYAEKLPVSLPNFPDVIVSARTEFRAGYSGSSFGLLCLALKGAGMLPMLEEWFNYMPLSFLAEPTFGIDLGHSLNSVDSLGVISSMDVYGTLQHMKYDADITHLIPPGWVKHESPKVRYYRRGVRRDLPAPVDTSLSWTAYIPAPPVTILGTILAVSLTDEQLVRGERAIALEARMEKLDKKYSLRTWRSKKTSKK